MAATDANHTLNLSQGKAFPLYSYLPLAQIKNPVLGQRGKRKSMKGMAKIHISLTQFSENKNKKSLLNFTSQGI